jgi:hypothetical protein
MQDFYQLKRLSPPDFATHTARFATSPLAGLRPAPTKKTAHARETHTTPNTTNLNSITEEKEPPPHPQNPKKHRQNTPLVRPRDTPGGHPAQASETPSGSATSSTRQTKPPETQGEAGENQQGESPAVAGRRGGETAGDTGVVSASRLRCGRGGGSPGRTGRPAPGGSSGS